MALDDDGIPDPDIPSDSQPALWSDEWADCYRAEMPFLQRYLMYTFNLSNIDDSHDPAHEAFEELFKKWPEVRKPRKWLRTVAFRKMLAHLPKNEISLDNIIYDPAADETASARLMLNEEERAARAAISTLPVTQRQVFSMYFDAFSYSEIAEVLEITEAAARKNMERARAQLRELLT